MCIENHFKLTFLQDVDGTPQLDHDAGRATYMNFQTLSECQENENDQYPKLFKNDGLSEVLSTHQLTNARVIGQADRKFIAFTIPIDVSSQQEATEKSMIIIADQHAVDERILLERMLKSILDPRKQVDQRRRLASDGCILLSPPRKLQVSGSEREKALQYSSVFNRWGIEFFASPNSHLSKDPLDNIATSDSRHFHQLRSASKYFGQKVSSQTNDTHYIQVTKIPRVISDRCTTNTMLLKQIICDHIAWMESQPQSQRMDNFQPDDEAGAWSRYLRHCPRGIVDILKSKACRNAIMFNDSLTDQQCQKLIDLVSDCAFPFQCAHGRYASQ
jgi:DNA mismatch repair ATPase MutL